MNSCSQTEVLTAKFFDATTKNADIDDLQEPLCTSRDEDDSTTALNETYLEFHPSHLTLATEVDRQD